MLPDFGLSGRNQSPVIWSFVFKKTANRSIKKNRCHRKTARQKQGVFAMDRMTKIGTLVSFKLWRKKACYEKSFCARASQGCGSGKYPALGGAGGMQCKAS
jgi:hypothetical protein